VSASPTINHGLSSYVLVAWLFRASYGPSGRGSAPSSGTSSSLPRRGGNVSHVHTRLLQPSLAQLTDPDPPTPSALRAAARDYQRALEELTREAGFAA
jgi:hypothetical protein